MRILTKSALRASIRSGAAGMIMLGACPALAQEAEAEESSEAVEAEAAATGADPRDIVVTGTLIRGIEPPGAAVIGVSEAEIESIGASSTNDLLRRIPQMTQFLAIDQPLAAGQFQQVYKITIRNLDTLIVSTNNTLLLLDGHRMVNSGIKQNAPDPDVVPPGALARVEVLPDGGSATYGTDAIGGVINFITKKRFSGFDIDGRYGFADDYHTLDLNGTAGVDWGTGSAYVAYNYTETGTIFGRDRDWIRKFAPAPAGNQNPDFACNPANVLIRRGTVQTTYATPGLQPGTANACDLSDDQTVYPETHRHSALASVMQEFGDVFTLDLRGYYTQRKTLFYGTLNSNATLTAANPYYRRTTDNPAPQAALPQTVSFNWGPVLGYRSTETSTTVLKSWGVTPTLTADLGTWQVRAMLNYGWSSSLAYNQSINPTLLAQAAASTNPATALNPYDIASTNSAVLANIVNFGGYALGRQSMKNYRLIADGPLATWAGGDIRLAVGVEYLRETFKGKQRNLADPRNAGPNLPFQPTASRNNKSVFGELAVPIIGEGNRFGGAHSLDLSVSARYDDYNDFGSTFNPKVALTWKPVEWINVRGNWGTSFNAPGLADDAESAVDANILLVTASLLPNPLPGMFTAAQAQWPVIVLQGGVPGIEPQEATTWQIGADIEPPFVPGLRLSASYFDIDFKNIIGTPPAQRLVDLYTFYGDYYTMNPTAAQVLAAAAEVPGGVAVVTPLLAPGALPIYNLLDSRRRNLGRVKLAGLDFSASYRTETGFGSLDFSFGGSVDLKRENQPVSTLPFIDTLLADTNKLRWNASAGANVGPLRTQLTWYHRHGYPITPTAANNNQARAGSFNVFDLFVRYDLSDLGGAFDETALTLNVNNLFDQEPPIYRGTSQTTQGHGYINGTTVGRLIQLGFKKSF